MENRQELLAYKIGGLSEVEALRLLAETYAGEVVFSSSFSFEDQAITHMILSAGLPIDIFTLDTGRLFKETYSVWSSTNERYHTHIKPYYPSHEPLEQFVEKEGPNSFYITPELRKQCCYLRKVEPLGRALKGKKVWITGLRAEHSPDRQNIEQLEWDGSHQLFKFHPILHWTTEQTRAFIDKHNIPYNSLHDKGFVSIGCEPCTRAIRPGEDFRAGRWWWEDNSKKECGLHVHS